MEEIVKPPKGNRTDRRFEFHRGFTSGEGSITEEEPLAR